MPTVSRFSRGGLTEYAMTKIGSPACTAGQYITVYPDSHEIKFHISDLLSSNERNPNVKHILDLQKKHAFPILCLP